MRTSYTKKLQMPYATAWCRLVPRLTAYARKTAGTLIDSGAQAIEPPNSGGQPGYFRYSVEECVVSPLQLHLLHYWQPTSAEVAPLWMERWK